MDSEVERALLSELRKIRAALERLAAATEGGSRAPARGGPPVSGAALGAAEALRSFGQTPESTRRRRGSRQRAGS